MLTKSDIDWLKDEFLPALAKAVKDDLKDKLDDIATKMDNFSGEVKAIREAQELHANDHSKINDRFDKIDKHLGVSIAS